MEVDEEKGREREPRRKRELEGERREKGPRKVSRDVSERYGH